MAAAGRFGQLAHDSAFADSRGGHVDLVRRTKLWRLLSGDDKFSVHHRLSRVENAPAAN